MCKPEPQATCMLCSLLWRYKNSFQKNFVELSIQRSRTATAEATRTTCGGRRPTPRQHSSRRTGSAGTWTPGGPRSNRAGLWNVHHLPGDKAAAAASREFSRLRWPTPAPRHPDASRPRDLTIFSNSFTSILSMSLHFSGHFPVGPRWVNTRMSPFWILLELRMMEVVVTTGDIKRAKLQSNHYHQQTSTQTFIPDALPVA